MSVYKCAMRLILRWFFFHLYIIYNILILFLSLSIKNMINIVK